MRSQIDTFLARALAAWVVACSRRARQVIAGTLLLTALFGVFAALELGINSDNVRLISEDLPSRRNHEAFARLFPNLENALLVVVDGDTPELARESATALAAAIAARKDRFTAAYVPGGGPFFQTHGLLYRSPEELDEFADQMARLQPILATLERDPSIASLASLVRQGLERTRRGQRSSTRPEEWAAILDTVGRATVDVYSEFPLAVSWEQMMLQGSAVEVVKRWVIVAHPILDFDSLLAARDALAEIRGLARELDLTPEHGVRVRITGNPALNYEEMIGIAWNLGLGGVVCFFFVAAVLLRALRSPKLVAAAVLTLLVGLVWTAAFAAAAVGHLSLVSASFAILFIGLGVDFAVHLGMAYAARLREGTSHERALAQAAAGVGSSLVLCTLTTAIGFYVFVPTDYLGVAELGLISGTGMVIILVLTLTFFPALLSRALRIDPERELASALHFRSHWWRVFESHPRAVCGVAAALFAAALVCVPGARFDANVVAMRDPTTESVQAFDDLLAQSGAMSPWYLNSVAPDLAHARRMATRMRRLDVVSHALTLADYVPEEQDEKLEILTDVAYLMETPPLAPTQIKRLSVEEQVSALRALHDFLGQPWLGERHSELAESMHLLHRQLGNFLTRIDGDGHPEEALAKLDRVLLSGLPAQMARLRTAVSTGPITMQNLPRDLVQRMIAPDDQARVQIFPKENLSDEASFARFTDAVQRVDPQATGVAINLVEFARATKASFRQALISALIAISLLLFGLWRRLRPMLLVMTPLLLSSVATVAAMAVLEIPFNFANVVVIPLLLGIGVDSGIHLVHRAEFLRAGDEELMDSTTARAVFYSALTTTISFGTLAFSSHRGLSGLGIVLSIGMLLTVAANLIVLPALLRGKRSFSAGSR